MKEITIISGKGGTGKTSVTAAFASLAKKAVYCDNDVDAANLHLIFKPETEKETVFQGNYQASIDAANCSLCGVCMNHCRFDAIKILNSGMYYIDPYACEGCRLCERICPEEAIHSERSKNNYAYISSSRFGTLVHASMGPGEENSGKLVTKLRGDARAIAEKQQLNLVINDGPPGIGCAAISSVTGTDLVIVVTEPTVSGFHDLKRVISLVQSFNIPILAIINKSDLNDSITKNIKNYLDELNIDVLATLPFSKTVVEATVNAKNIFEFSPDSPVSHQLEKAWMKIEKKLKM